MIRDSVELLTRAGRVFVASGICLCAATVAAAQAPGAGDAPAAASWQPKPEPRLISEGNLLTNPGFESGYREVGSPELVLADGWRPWWDGQKTRPEFRDEPYVRLRDDGSVWAFGLRVFHGANVQKFFTSSSVHDAGMYQTVAPQPPGTALRFSIWVHSWSSDCDDPCVSPREPCRPPSPNSHGTYRVQVGIDTSGSSPPEAGGMPPSAVAWSSPVVYEPYDHWFKLSAEGESTGAEVTVYTRGSPKWPVKHNDSYWDDARLEVIGGAAQRAVALDSAPDQEVDLEPWVYLPVALNAHPLRELLPRPVPPGADLRIEYPIRYHPGQVNFHQPTCDELEFESLLVKNYGLVDLEMGGWTLENLRGDTYEFPPLTLKPQDRVRVWTKAGEDVTDGTFADVYWNRSEPVWHNDSDEAVIRDGNGTEVARRGYP